MPYALIQISEQYNLNFFAVYSAKDTTLPLPSLVPLGAARLSPLPWNRVQAEATVGHTSVAGGSLP